MTQVSKMMAAAKQRGYFETVCKHYGCTQDEVEEMREIANRDKENARECFAYLANKISEGIE